MNPSRFASGAIGGWKELGRTTLGSAGDTISVGSITDKRYYMILGDIRPTGGRARAWMRGGNGTVESGSVYAQRYTVDGAADATNTSLNLGMFQGNSVTPESNNYFMTGYLANLSAKEKLGINHTAYQNATGAATAPSRSESVGKIAFTSNPLDILDFTNIDAGDFNTGSEMVVLGWDPADTHTTNFWEQIGTGSGTGVLDVTASATKKYNWIQGFFYTTTSSVTIGYQLGNSSLDTGSNYAHRYSNNGAADTTGTSQTNAFLGGGGFDTTYRISFNLFFINNSANEKLITGNLTYGTSGAGTAPNRMELAEKWANTSNQADHFGVYVSTGSVNAASELRWWGSN